MSDSDTPRTDAVRLPSEVLLPASEKHLGSAVRGAIQILGDHARQLERELAAKDAELKEAHGRIKLLEIRRTNDFISFTDTHDKLLSKYKLCHDELLEIHKVIMCIAEVTEVKDSDPYTLKAVKQMAIRINEQEENFYGKLRT